MQNPNILDTLPLADFAAIITELERGSASNHISVKKNMGVERYWLEIILKQIQIRFCTHTHIMVSY